MKYLAAIVALAVLAGCATGNTTARPPSAQEQAITDCKARGRVAYKAPGTRTWVCVSRDQFQHILNSY